MSYFVSNYAIFHKIHYILMINAFLPQNLFVKILALFPLIFLGWQIVSAIFWLFVCMARQCSVFAKQDTEGSEIQLGRWKVLRPQFPPVWLRWNPPGLWQKTWNWPTIAFAPWWSTRYFSWRWSKLLCLALPRLLLPSCENSTSGESNIMLLF